MSTLRTERHALRFGAVVALAGVALLIASELLHGGHHPDDLRGVLPEYAANPYWKAVHLGQFLGFLGAAGGVLVLLDYIKAKSESPVARYGLFTTAIAAATYAANQAVDGVAIKYAADAFVSANQTDKSLAFQIAETVRHIEQGLSSLAALNLGLTLLLCGASIVSTNLFAKWLGWAALLVGSCYLVSALFLNYVGFSQHIFSFWSGNLLLLWLLSMAAALWRESRGGASG